MVIFNACCVVWIVYMILEGYRDAHYYDAVTRYQSNKDLHPVFTLQRMLMALVINIACIGLGYKLVLLNVALVVMQPFFHNGMYYRTRNKLNPEFYPKKWLDQSSSSKAKSTKYETPTMRIIGVILAAVAIAILCII